MTNQVTSASGFIECVASAAREGDHQTRGVLHVVETKLLELNASCLEAEKVVKDDRTMLLLLRIRSQLVEFGTSERAPLTEKIMPLYEKVDGPIGTAPVVDTAV